MWIKTALIALLVFAPLATCAQAGIQVTEWMLTSALNGEYNAAASAQYTAYCVEVSSHVDVHCVEMNGDVFPVATGPGNQTSPDIDENLIVYVDDSFGDFNVSLYDIDDHSTHYIIASWGKDFRPAISDGNVVFVTDRLGTYDIYLYRTDLHIEEPVATGDGEENYPAIDGDIVAWEVPEDGNLNIYAADIGGESIETFPIATSVANEYDASISGSRIAYSCSGDVFVYDLSSGQTTQITADSCEQKNIQISYHYVLWNDDRNGNEDVFLHDLSSGRDYAVIDEPHDQWLTDVTGNRAVYHDNRWGNSNIFTCTWEIKHNWYVPEDAPTIQAGIDSASAGDTVVVACGLYEESNIMMKSGVWLRSETREPDCVTIDAQAHQKVFTVDDCDSTTVIEGLTLAGGSAPYGGGLLCRDSSPCIIKCLFSDNQSTPLEGYGRGGGMFCLRSAPVLADCIFAGNVARAEGRGGAVYCAGGYGVASRPVFEGCTFYGNTPESTTESGLGGGLYLADSSDVTLDRCIIAFSTVGAAVECEPEASATLTCCDLYGNPGGDWVGYVADQDGVAGNFSEDPRFCEPDSSDFTLQDTSPCSPANSPTGCGLIGARGVGCEGSAVDLPSILQDQLTLEVWPTAAADGPIQIKYVVPAETAGTVHLDVFDVTGRQMRALVGRQHTAGRYMTGWDGLDGAGASVGSGMYFLRLSTEA
ncbi:right-handed parallel beta-helix repeat-containing protein, partial [Candidatus Eisenbacteria bacterium]